MKYPACTQQLQAMPQVPCRIPVHSPLPLNRATEIPPLQKSGVNTQAHGDSGHHVRKGMKGSWSEEENSLGVIRVIIQSLRGLS